MISEMREKIDNMGENDLINIICDLESREGELSLDQQIELYLALIKANYLDRAVFQIQLIYNEIKDRGLSSEFVAEHPDLKNNLKAAFRIGEDACGNIFIDEVDPGDESCCIGCCCGSAGVICCIAACFGQSGADCLLSPIDPDNGWCCNCNEGGCCCNCCDGCCDTCGRAVGCSCGP